MTFNAGILKVYTIENVPNSGGKPIKGLRLSESFFYGYETLGFNRYYTALKANQQIEAVVRIPEWNEIDAANSIVRLENGKDYRIVLSQPIAEDDSGARYTRLSLERINESYDVISN